MTFNPIIHLNIPKAVVLVMNQAITQERIGHKQAAGVWMSLAERIEMGDYISSQAVDGLVKQYPFLQECRR